MEATSNIAFRKFPWAVGIGKGLRAEGYGEVVLGSWNVMQAGANQSSLVTTQKLFTLGNGTGSAARSDALVVKWNGDTTVYGNLATTKTLTTTQGAQVTGDVTATGNVTATGTVQAAGATFSGRVRIAPRGGISMGEFTQEPTP